ncbi:MAG: glycosyltransferase family 2 protein [Candidatus Omnitrophica bacterium]|nr:glycosyltransferase family 2 protein [Candidatus Omnitrophota bacterium]
MKKNICILIPAHNEARTIKDVVQKVKAKGLDVLVVDDGSSDNSGALAREAGAVVLVNFKNQGKGFSLQRGFDHISGQNYEALITLDADGQHAVEDLDGFIALYEEKNPDVICGNRMQDHRGMPFVRLLTNKIMSALISLVCRQKIHDTQCGYRLIKTDVLRNVQLSSSAFEIESEVLIKASKKRYRIASVPVKTIYAGEVSKINPFFDTARFIVYIIREMFVR